MGDKEKPSGELIEVQFDRGPSPKELRVRSDEGRARIAEHNARVLDELRAREAKQMEDFKARLLRAVRDIPMDRVPVLAVIDPEENVMNETPVEWFVSDEQSSGEPDKVKKEGLIDRVLNLNPFWKPKE